MIRYRMCDLSDCSEFRQTIEARPPAIVHGSLTLLAMLLVAAVVWGTVVRANVVVTAPGRVRPVDPPIHVFAESGGQIDSHAVEVFVEEGTRVTTGQVLVKLDTQRLENEKLKLERKIAACEEQIVAIRRLDELTTERFQSSEAKVRAELDRAERELERAKAERLSRIRQAEAGLAVATDRLTRYQQLVAKQAVTAGEFVESKNQVEQARETLTQSQLGVDDGHVSVLRRSLEQVAKDLALQRAEVDSRRIEKTAEAEAARKELFSVELDLKRSVLRSPIDGVIVSGRVKHGDVLEAGKPVFDVARQEGLHFETTVSSEDVGHLQVGMPVRIKLDAFDYQKYGTLHGTICFIAPDSKLVDAEKGQGGVAYVVRIELHESVLERGELRGDVRLGLGGTAEIVTRRESLLALLVREIRGTIRLD